MMLSQQFVHTPSIRWLSSMSTFAGPGSSATISGVIPASATCVIGVIEMDISFVSLASMTFNTVPMTQVAGSVLGGIYLLYFAIDLNNSGLTGTTGKPGSSGTMAMSIGGSTGHISMAGVYYSGAHPSANYLASNLHTNSNNGSSGTLETLSTPIAVPSNTVFLGAFGNGQIGGGYDYSSHNSTTRVSIPAQFGNNFPLLLQEATNLASGFQMTATSTNSINWVTCGAILA